MIPASIALHRRPTPAFAVLREILDLEGVADTKALCYNPWARCLGLVVLELVLCLAYSEGRYASPSIHWAEPGKMHRLYLQSK